MAGLDPAIHVFLAFPETKTWMPGTSSAKTRFALLPGHDDASLSIRLLTDETMPAYDNQNIFAKILRGEIPCYKVYESQHTLAFLDIMPRSPGHTLVIPKAPARGILDIADDDFAEVARTARRIARAAVRAFDAEGVIVQQFSEAASGQVVFHLHMHVMPMKAGVELLPAQTRKEDTAVLEEHATRLIAALKN